MSEQPGPPADPSTPTVDPTASEDAVAERLPLLHSPRRSGSTAGVEPWRQRVVALRTSLPQLARNPVVVSASTVAVTLAARLAVEVARRAIAGPAAAPRQVQVSGHVMHHVHVVQHLHVVHHTSSPIGWPALSAPPRR